MTFDPNITEAEVGEYRPRQRFQTGMEMLESWPGTVQTMGTTGARGGNTILRGGWGDAAGFSRRTKRAIKAGKAAPQVGSANIGSAIRNNNPFVAHNWSRYGSQDMFFSSGEKGAAYTPFNFLAKAGNWVARNTGVFGEEIGVAAKAAKSSGTGAGAFAPGFMSQMNAAERVGRGATVSAKSQAGLASYFGKAGMTVPEEIMTNPIAARTATYASVQGAVTGRMAGHMAALRDPNAIANAAKAWGTTTADMGGSAFGRGAAYATKSLEIGGKVAGEYGGIRGSVGGLKTAWKHGVKEAGEKAAGKVLAGEVAGKVATKVAATKAGAWAASRFAMASGALATGPAMPFIEAALLVMTAFDVAKMVGAGVAAAPRFAADAARSFTGGLNRQGFGVPYRTNELAVTSRARGVQAIQNSRLNARSVIGSEASGMAGYFG